MGATQQRVDLGADVSKKGGKQKAYNQGESNSYRIHGKDA